MTGSLALLIRSLRVDVRLMRTHLFRLLFVLIIYVILWSAQQTMMFRGAPGLHFFSSMSYVNCFMISLAGVSFFATTITEEKEEATLGLLKMAGINPLSILLGKLAPRLVSAFFLLSVQFPFTILAITLGGVTWHQVIATYCSLLAYLILLANVGLFFSVFSKRSSSASWKMAVLLILFYLVFPWLRLMMMFGMRGQSSGFAQLVTYIASGINEFSIWARVDTILTTGFAESAIGFQVVSNIVAGGVFFGISWATFNYFTRNEGSVSAPSRGLLVRPISTIGSRAGRRVWRNALAWKDFHFLTGGMPAMVVKFILYPILIFVFLSLFGWGRYNSVSHEEVGGWAMGVATFGFVIESSWYASGVFNREIKWNTLAGIMQLPLSTMQVVYAKLGGCMLGLIPAVFIFVLGAVVYPEGFSDVIENMLGEPEGWFVIFQFLFFVHLVAFLSLCVKWGALPLAIAAMFLAYMLFAACAVGMMMSGSSDGIFFLLSILELIGSIGLQFAIGHRLKVLAAK